VAVIIQTVFFDVEDEDIRRNTGKEYIEILSG
jgi:hypothetical protein